jgi:hypothetical protein
MEGTAKSVPPSLNEGDETAMTMQRLHTGWASVQPPSCQGTAPMKHLPLAGLLLLSLTACNGPDKGAAGGGSDTPAETASATGPRSRRIPMAARRRAGPPQQRLDGFAGAKLGAGIAEVRRASARRCRDWAPTPVASRCRPTTATTAATSCVRRTPKTRA